MRGQVLPSYCCCHMMPGFGGMGAHPQWLHCLLFAAGSSHQTAHLRSLFFSPTPKQHLASRTWRWLALKVSVQSREECYPSIKSTWQSRQEPTLCLAQLGAWDLGRLQWDPSGIWCPLVFSSVVKSTLLLQHLWACSPSRSSFPRASKLLCVRHLGVFVCASQV